MKTDKQRADIIGFESFQNVDWGSDAKFPNFTYKIRHVCWEDVKKQREEKKNLLGKKNEAVKGEV